MRRLRPIIALLFILAFSSNAIGSELIERYANAELYRIDSTTRQLKIGGDIENALPFDGGGYTPWNLVFAEGTPMGNWTWLGKGTIGYLIKPSISTVRMYPVRGDPTKFIEIAPLAAQPSIVNQISAKSLELYVDQPNTRWSLSMTPQGFKPNILLKPGYSGDGIFQFRFELNGGLTLSGAKIMDGATQVLKMHNPFLVDAEGINRAVDEQLIDGVVTLTANLSGLTYPVLVDPTLGPINPSMDTFLTESGPTTGFGQATVVDVKKGAGVVNRGLLQFDASAIPAGSSVTSATFSVFVWFSQIAGSQIDIYRHTIYDWEDASGANAEANWNNYKNPNVAWPGGAGADGDRDGTLTESSTAPAAGNWMDYTGTAIIQDAIDNRSGIYNIYMRANDETGTGQISCRSLEYGTAAQRPKLTVEYTEPVASEALRPWCSRKGYYNEKVNCALPYNSMQPF